MNVVKIGETILQLRKENGITQEQLANLVGVTAGAVCKWETGNSFPDISLLAPIARVLGVSIDNLLSFRSELTEDEVKEMKKELISLFLQTGYQAGEVKCNELLREYPNSVFLKLVIAELFYMYAMMSAVDSEDIYYIRVNRALELLHEVTESKETKYVSQALFSIANINMMLEKYEESEKAFKLLTESYIDVMGVYPMFLYNAGKKEESKVLCESMLLSRLMQNAAMISTLAKISMDEENYQLAYTYIETIRTMESMFQIGLHSGDYSLCRYYIKRNELELGAKYFRIYVEGLLETGYDYKDNIYFKDVKLEVSEEGQKLVRNNLYQSLIKEDILNVLAGLPEYEEAIGLLKEKLQIDLS